MLALLVYRADWVAYACGVWVDLVGWHTAGLCAINWSCAYAMRRPWQPAPGLVLAGRMRL